MTVIMIVADPGRACRRQVAFPETMVHGLPASPSSAVKNGWSRELRAQSVMTVIMTAIMTEIDHDKTRPFQNVSAPSLDM